MDVSDVLLLEYAVHLKNNDERDKFFSMVAPYFRVWDYDSDVDEWITFGVPRNKPSIVCGLGPGYLKDHKVKMISFSEFMEMISSNISAIDESEIL